MLSSMFTHTGKTRGKYLPTFFYTRETDPGWLLCCFFGGGSHRDQSVIISRREQGGGGPEVGGITHPQNQGKGEAANPQLTGAPGIWTLDLWIWNPALYPSVLFQASFALRLLIVSCAGSRLIQQGQQLHHQLAAVSWRRHVTARARFSLQLLLERTRQPVAFEGWGLFTVQKATMLSLFGFVLTYCVILIQMQVHWRTV